MVRFSVPPAPGTMPPLNETKRKRKTTELTIPRNEPGYILGYGKEAYDKKNYTLYDLKSAYIEHADDDEDTAHLKGDVYKYMGGSKCMPRKECEWSASIYLPDVRDDGAWIDLRAVRANKSKSRVKFAKKAKKGAELFVFRGLIKPILGCK